MTIKPFISVWKSLQIWDFSKAILMKKIYMMSNMSFTRDISTINTGLLQLNCQL